MTALFRLCVVTITCTLLYSELIEVEPLYSKENTLPVTIETYTLWSYNPSLLPILNC